MFRRGLRPDITIHGADQMRLHGPARREAGGIGGQLQGRDLHKTLPDTADNGIAPVPVMVV